MNYFIANTSYLTGGELLSYPLEYAQSREIDIKKLLQRSKIHSGLLSGKAIHISPSDYLRFLENLFEQLKSNASSFELGLQLLPGHLGNASHALLHAKNLRQALEILIHCQSHLSPLLAPHFVTCKENAILYWTDVCTTPRSKRHIVEMMMSAVAAMCRWLSGERLPWKFYFNSTQPSHIAQHEVHLGSALSFNQYFDGMMIPLRFLEEAWPRRNHLAVELALHNWGVETGLPHGRQSLPVALYNLLINNTDSPPSLEACAAYFDVSPATLKRHLALHNTHFQAELDQTRSHIALYLMFGQHYSNEKIAAKLGFRDVSNFRRAFRRWMGLPPATLRSQLIPGIA